MSILEKKLFETISSGKLDNEIVRQIEDIKTWPNGQFKPLLIKRFKVITRQQNVG